VRTIHHNRQARRAALCIEARRPGSRSQLALSLRGLALRAHGHDLARVAESIADELELSPEMIDELLWPGRRP
jgi:hypothetical protein